MSQRVRLCFRFLIALTAALFVSSAWAQSQSPQPQQNGQGNGQANVQVTTFQDWEVRCPQSSSGQNQCEMTQLVNNPDSGKPVVRVVMGYPPQIDSAAMIVVSPLGTRLAPGIQFSVDGNTPQRIPFQICLQQGCRADFPVENTLLSQMKRGNHATVSIVGPRGKELDLKVSLSGFTAAANKIAKQ